MSTPFINPAALAPRSSDPLGPHLDTNTTSRVTVVDRRQFLNRLAKTALFGAATASALPSLVLAEDTPPPSSILFFETGQTQWLFISGAFTWSQAMKMPTSIAITDPYGPGWLLAPMWTPQDFVNAANVTKLAMGDLRKKRGPFIGVFQNPGSAEPADGFMNLDGSVHFATWGKHDPNDGAKIHRNILRETAFRDALKSAAKLVTDWYFGAGTSDKVDPIINFVVNEISRPDGSRPKDDVVALWHEGDGRITAADVNFQSFYPVLLSRRKLEPKTTKPYLPTWPKVSGIGDLKDGMRVPRRSTLSWRWTNGARLGQLHIVNVKTGVTAINQASASTTRQDLTILRPGTYLYRARNITKYLDEWLEIGFVLV